MNIDTNWIIITLFVPVIIAFFKKEISSFIGDYIIYKNRMFDVDGDPGTGQDCYIQSSATGKFIRITVDKYQFGLSPSKRKIITFQSDPDGDPDKIIVVPYTYSVWNSIIKGSLAKNK